MIHFTALQKNKDIQALIKSTFDTDLALSGGWGYTPEEATIINALPEGMTLPQLEHMFIHYTCASRDEYHAKRRRPLQCD